MHVINQIHAFRDLNLIILLIYCVFNLIIVFQAFTEICRQILQTMSENNQVGTQLGGRINER